MPKFPKNTSSAIKKSGPFKMKSPYYKFKLNIRDTQGKDGYPTRMMCDFKTK